MVPPYSSAPGLPGSSRRGRESDDDDISGPEPRAAQRASLIQLRPITRTTTVTTTTTTTLAYPPLFVPPVAEPAVLSEAERNGLPPSSQILHHLARSAESLDPRLFPLANAVAPSGLREFAFGIEGHEARFSELEGQNVKPRASVSPRIRKAAAFAPEQPPRKRMKASQSAMPSPPARPSDDFAPASPVSDADRAEGDAELSKSTEEQAYSADVAALMSLPSIVEQFSAMAPSTQSYVLFNLLKRSSVPVLQRVSSIIEPALKRDFLTDLPLELVTAVLCHLDGLSLCIASRVCKQWHQRINGDGRAWLSALRKADLFVGDGSEERDANRLMGKMALSAEQLFFKQWQAGVWKQNFNQEQASKPTAEKVATAMRAARRRTISLSPATKRRMSDPSSPRLFGPDIAPRLTGNSTHPYKILFCERFSIRKRWLRLEPQRTSFPGHSQMTVTCLQFDKKRIISASDEHLINVFETTTGKALARLEGHEGGVWALQYLGNILVSGSTDRTVRVWDLNRMQNTHTFVGHTSTVRCLQIIEPINVNPDANGEPIWEPPYPMIVTGSRDCTLRTWKLPSPTRDPQYHPFVPLSPGEDESHFDASKNPWHLRHFTGHRSAVRALAAHGRIFVSGSYDFTVRVWDALDGECKHILQGHTGKIYSVVYEPVTQRCASGSMDGNVRLWCTITGTCLRNLEGHTSLVGLLGLSSDILISAAADATLRLWQPDSGECTAILNAHAGAITCFQHDQYKVISGSDGTLKLWDVKTGLFVRDLLDGLSGVWQCAFDERYCVAAVQRNGRSEFDVLDFGVTSDAPDVSPSNDSSQQTRSLSIARIGDPIHSDDSDATYEERVPYNYDEPIFRDSPLARVSSRRDLRGSMTVVSQSDNEPAEATPGHVRSEQVAEISSAVKYDA